ncbi:MAG: HNH endonuclease [Pirellulaceae bacterium]
MDRQTREFIRQRADNRCEYCGLHQSQAPSLLFHTEHIRARQHGGDDSADNGCLACPTCNFKKGPNQSGYDPLTGLLVGLYNPRNDIWSKHFREDDGMVEGLTTQGRATVALLDMNRERLVRLRQIVEEDE